MGSSRNPSALPIAERIKGAPMAYAYSSTSPLWIKSILNGTVSEKLYRYLAMLPKSEKVTASVAMIHRGPYRSGF